MGTRLIHPIGVAAMSAVVGGVIFAGLTWAWSGSLVEAVLMAIPWMLVMGVWVAYQSFYGPRAADVAAGKGRAWESVDHGCQMTVQAEPSLAREIVLDCLRERGEVEILESEGGLLVAALSQSGARDLFTAVFTPQGDGVGIRLTSRPATPKSLLEGPRNHATVQTIADRLVERFEVEARQPRAQPQAAPPRESASQAALVRAASKDA